MSPQDNVTPAAANLLAAAQQAATTGGLPPVHLWNPPDCGEIDIRIARDGTWFHEGRPITRAPLVRLFASILRRDGDRHVLVTPVEKVGITVEDAPFVAVDVDVSGQGRDQRLAFVTNVGDRVTADATHPIRVDHIDDAPAPYVEVRAGLMARIDRKTFYRLAELGQTAARDGVDWFGLWSAGVFFPILPADRLR